MTIDECVAKAASEIDRHLANNLLDYEDLLRAHGATPLELETALARARADFAEERAKCLRRLRGWLERGGEELH